MHGLIMRFCILIGAGRASSARDKLFLYLKREPTRCGLFAEIKAVTLLFPDVRFHPFSKVFCSFDDQENEKNSFSFCCFAISYLSELQEFAAYSRCTPLERKNNAVSQQSLHSVCLTTPTREKLPYSRDHQFTRLHPVW